ncbi:protein of unknown function DUF1236 [Rhodopseudomonas palustris TIE-1]|uniref:DUF1236 domain-containing protein n=1 Tax=Rhodopseudomonas palustris TaxID=1076 RepID=UPI000164A7E2|nr:DUF1236 domain-containing protein [Rhodopseudomonas palustris]ACF01225.1 protein of unknown function DUF1236 [Rhodopseudomonas palustris TIE-1]
MNHRLLLSVAAAALIAGGAVANAQSPSSGNSSGSSGATPSSPSVGQSAPGPSGAGGSQMQRSESPSGTSREVPAMDRSANDATKSVSDHDRDRSKMKAEDRNERSGNRNADNDRDHDRSKQRGADSDRSSTTTGQAGARAQLSTEQRTKITTVIKNQHIEPQTNVNFSISVGTRVPREVHFHPLPTDIVTIYPDWRGYEFFMVRDEIVVVNPRTLEIVAVLDI